MQARGEVLEAEARKLGIVDEPGAGMAGELAQRRVADRGDEQVAADGQGLARGLALASDAVDQHRFQSWPGTAGQSLDHGPAMTDGEAALRGAGAARRVLSEIDHLGDGYTRIDQVERGLVALLVGGDHDGSAAGADAPEAKEPLCRGGEHDPGQVVVAEHHRLLDRAGGEHDGPARSL